MKRLITLTAALGCVLGLHAVAAAHGGAHETLMGTIHGISESEIIVKTVDHGGATVALHPSTRYVTTRDEKGSWAELHDGMRVVIKLDVREDAADEVRYRREEESGDDG